MNNRLTDHILRSAAADAEGDISEYMAEVDEQGERTSPELDRRVMALIGRDRRAKRIRALTSAAAGIAACLVVWVSLSGVLPERYLIGEVAEPSWFPADVTKTVITDTETLFEAVYTANDGREFYLSLEKDTSNKISASTPLFQAEGEYDGSDIYVDRYGDEIEADSANRDYGDSVAVKWQDGDFEYTLSGDAREIELRRMARSARGE